MFSFKAPENFDFHGPLTLSSGVGIGEQESSFEESCVSQSADDWQESMNASLQELAQDQYLDDQLATELRESLEPDVHADHEHDDKKMDSVTAIDSVKAHSPRISELHHRQKSCRDMRELVDKSLKALTEIGEGTDTVLNYLLNSETEIAHLELVESQHTNLREMSIQLAERTIELKARLTRQEQEIEILEALKKRMRNMIERSKADIARINEKREAQASAMATQDITISHLGREKNLLREKNQQLEARCKVADAEIQEKFREVESSREKISMTQNRLKLYEKQIESLIEERDQFLQKARNVMIDHNELKRVHHETLAKLDESVHSEEALRREYEEILKNKDARILKLESSNGVLNNQVLFSDEVIASLNARLEEQAQLAPHETFRNV